MNLLTFGSVTGVALGALYPVVNYFIPPRVAGSGGGTTAKDEAGNNVTATGWLSAHKEGDRSLVQGLKGDPTYLIVEGPEAIGNYGINPDDNESSGPHVRGFVIGELCHVPSNWRSNETLADYFSKHGILGIEDIDTRALTKHLRSLGAMRSCLTTELDTAAAIEAARNSPSMEGMDYVGEVSTPESYP